MVYGGTRIACLQSKRKTKKSTRKELACMAFANICLLLIRFYLFAFYLSPVMLIFSWREHRVYLPPVCAAIFCGSLFIFSNFLQRTQPYNTILVLHAMSHSHPVALLCDFALSPLQRISQT